MLELTLTIKSKDTSNLVDALKETTRLAAQGYTSGTNSNEFSEFTFGITGETEDDESDNDLREYALLQKLANSAEGRTLAFGGSLECMEYIRDRLAEDDSNKQTSYEVGKLDIDQDSQDTDFGLATLQYTTDEGVFYGQVYIRHEAWEWMNEVLRLH